MGKHIQYYLWEGAQPKIFQVVSGERFILMGSLKNRSPKAEHVANMLPSIKFINPITFTKHYNRPDSPIVEITEQQFHEKIKEIGAQLYKRSISKRAKAFSIDDWNEKRLQYLS